MKYLYLTYKIGEIVAYLGIMWILRKPAMNYFRRGLGGTNRRRHA